MWKTFLKIAAVIVIALILQHFAFIGAYAQRGYEAVGSEYFVFPVVVFAGLYITGFFKDDEELEEYDEEEDDLDAQYRDAV